MRRNPDRLSRPRVGDPVRDPAVEGGVMPALLTVIAFALFLWPSDRAPTVPQMTPQVKRDTTGTQPVKRSRWLFLDARNSDSHLKVVSTARQPAGNTVAFTVKAKSGDRHGLGSRFGKLEAAYW
jgi:hypothetical protein